MSIDLRQFHASFFSESLEGLDLDRSQSSPAGERRTFAELLNAIFRAIHSSRPAGSLGFRRSAASPTSSKLLDDLRKGDFDPDPDAVDTMLACVDHVRFTSARPSKRSRTTRSAKQRCLKD